MAKVKAHGAFAALYSNSEFKMIELGKLLAFQHWMDTDVSDGVHGAGNPAPPSDADVLSRCLPPNFVHPTSTRWVVEGEGNHRSLTVYSMNNTLSYQLGWDQTKGDVRFLITPQPNLMLVREFGGRYLLANGYHRAWWLRSRKVEMVPVVITHVTTPEQFVPAHSIPFPILMSDQPALVDHFFDDAISVTVDVRSMLRAVKITAEVSMIPRLV